MERSKAIFDWIFSIPVVDETNNSNNKNKDNLNGQQQQPYHLLYLATPDTGITDVNALAARYEKELNSLRTIQTFQKQTIAI